MRLFVEYPKLFERDELFWGIYDVFMGGGNHE